MGVPQSSFTTTRECTCGNELLPPDAGMEHEAHWIEWGLKICPNCKGLTKNPIIREVNFPTSVVDHSPSSSSTAVRKRHSFNDTLLQESQSNVSMASSKSLPLFSKRRLSSPSYGNTNNNHNSTINSTTTRQQSSPLTTRRSSTSPRSVPSSTLNDNLNPSGSPKNSSLYLKPFSQQTKVSRSSNSKSLRQLGASGEKLSSTTLPIPIVKVKKKKPVNTELAPISSPHGSTSSSTESTGSKSPPPPQFEEIQKITVNLGNAFPNHGTRSFPIYILPPQEIPEQFNSSGKKLGDHKSQMEEKLMRRRSRKVIVQ